jgi:hypothetical protein
MSNLIEQRANSLGFQFEKTTPHFDLSVENNNILEALVSQTGPQLLNAFDFAKKQLPLPKTAAVSVEGHFYRLPGHNRSFCYALTEHDSFLGSPVLVFKGTEPLLRDFATLIAWMLQAPLRRSSRVMADHFPLAEGKIPGALSFKEALRETEIALELQNRHLKYYGELAKLPTPLLIHRFPDEARNACTACLRRTLSQPAFEKIQPLLESGLAVYVYHYPAAPIRANYWGGVASPAVSRYLEHEFSEQVALTGWINLIVRLLYLGYLPYSVRNEGLGACMDFGNATLDGGFCDPDSIIPIASSPDDEFLREGLVQSLSFLQKTMQLMLGLSHPPDLYPSIEEFVCGQYVRQMISQAMQSEGRPGLQLDDRLLRMLSPQSISDVKRDTTRRNRFGSYTHFLKRSM